MNQFNIIYRSIVIILLVAVCSNLSFSQIIEGVVLSNTTNAPLSFVNIGVVGFNKGVISKEDGSFKIDIPSELNNETLRLSIIGYITKDYTISDIRKNPLKVLMTPRDYPLNEVIIRDYTRKSLKKYGNAKAGKTTTGHSGDGAYGVGFEWGLKILEQKVPYKPKAINFHLRFNTVDSVLFRINIYKVEDGLPVESLILDDLTIKSYKKQKWVSADISDRNLTINEDIVVTLQVLRIWYSKKGKNHFFMTHSKTPSDERNYIRDSSHDGWKQTAPGSIALYISAWDID